MRAVLVEERGAIKAAERAATVTTPSGSATNDPRAGGPGAREAPGSTAQAG